MSIAALLQAAEYLERREREAEHGYASTLPPEDVIRSMMKRPKTKKSQGSRTTHNELEKNRRAHLRNCLEKLKEMVPLGNEASRHTTLGLLTKAKRFIKNLEVQERKHAIQKEQLSREQRYLRRRLDQLGAQYSTSTSSTKRRSVSECSLSSTLSASSASSSVSSPSISVSSESDEIDVIGYGSGSGGSSGGGSSSSSSGNQSDTDDQSSVQSASSDSGVAMSTSRLTLHDMEVI